MDFRYHPYDSRLMKRTRQACEPCRRKKSKCTGERPGCSTCARLRQQCFYAVEPHLQPPGDGAHEPDRQHSQQQTLRPLEAPAEPEADQLPLQTRVDSLESTLAQVLESLRNGPHILPSPLSSDARQFNNGNADITTVPSASASAPSSGHLPGLPPWQTVMSAAHDYLRYCDSQPISLFHPGTFVDSLSNRDAEVIYGVLALAMRFSADPGVQRNASSLYSQTAHRLTMNRVAEGRVELSTIQALCLISFVEFCEGTLTNSHIHSSLAMTLAQCAGLHREAHESDDAILADERRRCYWSIVLLRRLLGWAVDGSDDTPKARSPPFPDSPSSPPSEVVTSEGRLVASESSAGNGILGTVIRLSKVWTLVQDYVRSRGMSGGNISPWYPESKYSSALRTLMDLGKELPPLHRYRCVRLADVTPDDLVKSRAYWAPWFLSRFLYHTSICLLNHPLLISLQFHGGRNISEVFLQQTAYLASHHTAWILHFIDFFESRHYRQTDPFVGYCVAVVATIELQQSFSDDRSLCEKKRANYEKCLAFIRRLGRDWQYMQTLANKLENLADQISSSYTTSISNAGAAPLTISIVEFLEILEVARSSSPQSGAPTTQGSIFGATLSQHAAPQETSSQPTHSVRLPAITAIDPSMLGSRRNTGNVGTPSRACNKSPPPGPGEPPLSQTNPVQLVDGDDMFLSIDQLFGSHLQDVNAWWNNTWDDTSGSLPPNGFHRIV